MQPPPTVNAGSRFPGAPRGAAGFLDFPREDTYNFVHRVSQLLPVAGH